MAHNFSQRAKDTTEVAGKEAQVLGMFHGEALTATNVATTLNTTLQTVRIYLRKLVARKQLHETKVGRVVYFHEKGVKVPEGERPKAETNDDGEYSESDENDEAETNDQEDETHYKEVEAESEDESLSGAFATGQIKHQKELKKASKHDDGYIEGDVDVSKVVPAYDPEAAKQQVLESVRHDTHRELLPLVVEALERMIALEGDKDAFPPLYAEYGARGIDRRILIGWYRSMKAYGLAPSTIIEKRVTKKSNDTDAMERKIAELERDALLHREIPLLWQETRDKPKVARYGGPTKNNVGYRGKQKKE